MADEEKKQKKSTDETWSWSEHKRMWIMILSAGGLMMTAIMAWVITKP
jgi:hypothetical protein